VTGREDADASRVEAAEAGVHAELEERDTARGPEEHVTATDVATQPVAARSTYGHHHHPPDPNVGVVRARVGRGTVLAAVVSAAVSIVAVVLLALAVGSH
jgi:hypothetical protein